MQSTITKGKARHGLLPGERREAWLLLPTAPPPIIPPGTAPTEPGSVLRAPVSAEHVTISLDAQSIERHALKYRAALKENFGDLTPVPPSVFNVPYLGPGTDRPVISPLSEPARAAACDRILCCLVPLHSLRYAPQLPTVVSILLTALPEQHAFSAADSILRNNARTGMLLTSRKAEAATVEAFLSLIRQLFPRLAAHMDVVLGHHLSYLLVASWFRSMFTGWLPSAHVAVVFDSYLYEGPKILFRYGLALLRHTKHALKSTRTPVEFLSLLRGYIGGVPLTVGKSGPMSGGMGGADSPALTAAQLAAAAARGSSLNGSGPASDALVQQQLHTYSFTELQYTAFHAFPRLSRDSINALLQAYFASAATSAANVEHGSLAVTTARPTPVVAAADASAGTAARPSAVSSRTAEVTVAGSSASSPSWLPATTISAGHALTSASAGVHLGPSVIRGAAAARLVAERVVTARGQRIVLLKRMQARAQPSSSKASAGGSSGLKLSRPSSPAADVTSLEGEVAGLSVAEEDEDSDSGDDDGATVDDEEESNRDLSSRASAAEAAAAASSRGRSLTESAVDLIQSFTSFHLGIGGSLTSAVASAPVSGGGGGSAFCASGRLPHHQHEDHSSHQHIWTQQKVAGLGCRLMAPALVDHLQASRMASASSSSNSSAAWPYEHVEASDLKRRAAEGQAQLEGGLFDPWTQTAAASDSIAAASTAADVTDSRDSVAAGLPSRSDADVSRSSPVAAASGRPPRDVDYPSEENEENDASSSSNNNSSSREDGQAMGIDLNDVNRAPSLRQGFAVSTASSPSGAAISSSSRSASPLPLSAASTSAAPSFASPPIMTYSLGCSPHLASLSTMLPHKVAHHLLSCVYTADTHGWSLLTAYGRCAGLAPLLVVMQIGQRGAGTDVIQSQSRPVLGFYSSYGLPAPDPVAGANSSSSSFSAGGGSSGRPRGGSYGSSGGSGLSMSSSGVMSVSNSAGNTGTGWIGGAADFMFQLQPETKYFGVASPPSIASGGGLPPLHGKSAPEAGSADAATNASGHDGSGGGARGTVFSTTAPVPPSATQLYRSHFLLATRHMLVVGGDPQRAGSAAIRVNADMDSTVASASLLGDLGLSSWIDDGSRHATSSSSPSAASSRGRDVGVTEAPVELLAFEIYAFADRASNFLHDGNVAAAHESKAALAKSLQRYWAAGHAKR